MPTVLSLREVINYIKGAPSAFQRATTKAMLVTLQHAEVEARKNAKKQFTGRNDRKLSGLLFNSIYSGIERESPTSISGFVGTRNIPYGRIHEFGGEIEPVKAKKLWIPVYKNAGKMTPTEFIRAKNKDPNKYFLSDKVAGLKPANNKLPTRRIIPIFFLVDKATIPARPYLVPALEVATSRFPDNIERFMREEATK